MSEENFEQFLRDSFKTAEINVNIQSNEIDQQIINKLNRIQESRKKKKRFVLKVVAIIVVLLSGYGAVAYPKSAYAFKEKMIQTIEHWGSQIQIIFSGNDSYSDTIDIEVGKIQPDVAFTILTPHYIPPGFKFNSISKSAQDEQIKVNLSFSDHNSVIILSQTQITGNRGQTVNVSALQGKAEKVVIGEYECNMITFEDGSCNAIWITEDNIQCELFSNLSPKQVKEIILSIY